MATANSRNPAITFIFFTLLIDVIGFGLIIPVMPDLIKSLAHVTTSRASEIGGWMLVVYALMQFLFAPVLGNLSDKYGRRPILLFSLFGFGIDYLLLSFAPTIAWFFVGRVISGITGASFTTANAYIADVSTDETRAKNFGIVGAAFGLGFMIGPAIGGVLGKWDIRYPFYIAAALTLVNWLYGYFVLPESLALENRRPFSWKRANPLGSLKQLRKYPSLSGLAISLTLIYLASHAVQSNWTFFNVEKFHWSPLTIGLSLTLVGVLVGAVQAGLTRVVNPKLGNAKSVYVGLIFYALGLALFAFATQSWMMFVFLVPYCLGGIAQPALQSIITGQVPANEQGELQGSLTSLMSLTTIFGPLIMTHLFAYFTRPNGDIYFPGAPFLLGAVLMVVSVVLAVAELRSKHIVAEVHPDLKGFPEGH
jgi:MFS transporter, DHA1 family, tetracycline resistance protein